VAAIAMGMATVWAVAGSTPAFADQVRQQEWWLGALNVSHAWQTSRGARVTVAVLSDGVDAAQADIGSAVTVGPDYTSASTTTTTFVGPQGTAIVSLIAGRGHGPGGTSGIVGVAPKARILSIRVTLDPADPALDSTTVGAGLPDAIANGIRYAVAHHATVIDLPADPGEPSPDQVAALPIPFRETQAPQLAGLTAAAGGSSAEKAAVAFARRRGVVLVAPAGDNAAGTDAVNYPAAYPGVLAVGAFGPAFAMAPYSSRQSYVALTAAGADMMAARAYGGYEVVNSTTAASAMVSGIAALVRSKYPSLTAAQVARVLTTSSVYQPTQASAGGAGSGSVDAQRALATARALAAPPDQRAGAGAVPLAQPAKPGLSPVTSDGLAPRVLRAAIISAGALIVLLLLIGAYTAAGRRRERKDADASAEWVRSTQNAFSPYGSADADKMLEYFAAPAGAATVAAGPFPQYPVAHYPVAQYPARQGADVGAAATAAQAGSAATGGSSATGGATTGSGTGAWVPLGPASRAQSRQPRVSGAPPWEPASEPDSELPWASVPGPAGGGSGATAAAAVTAADPVWPATAAASAPPSTSSAVQAWDDLAASSQTAGPTAADDSAAPPSWRASSLETPSTGAPSTGAPSSDAEPGSRPWPATSAFASAAPAPGSSLLDASPAPRSPSGSDWELPGGDASGQTAAPDDARWQSADSDAYRQPPSTPAAWPSSDSGTFRQPTADRDRWPAPDSGTHRRPAADPDSWPSSDSGTFQQPTVGADSWPSASDSGTHRKAGPAAGPWEAADSGTFQQPTSGPDSWLSASRDTDWQSAGDTSSADTGQHWLPAADTVDHDRWQSAGSGSQWQPTAASDNPDAAPPPSAASTAPWEPAPEAEPWEPAHKPEPWESAAQAQSPAASDRRDASPRPPVTSAAPWELAPKAEAWEPASDAQAWEPAAPPPPPAAESSNWRRGSAEATRDAAAEAAPRPSDAAETPAEPTTDSRWNSPGADSRWDPADPQPGWESAGARSRWASVSGADESSDRDEQLFAWRPSAQTETFPAIDDE
jgi:hypothetical protein